MNMQNAKSCPSREWLKRAAEQEERVEDFGVGGLASRLGLLKHGNEEGVAVIGQLIEFGRRRLGLSVEALAEKSDIDIRELVLIERESTHQISPRSIFELSEVLGIPVKGLAEVAGLVEARSERIESAMYQFAARSEPTAKLTPDEEHAYSELVKVIVELSE